MLEMFCRLSPHSFPSPPRCCPLPPHAAAGITCGFIGQGVANSLMVLRRHYAGGAGENDVAVPPLVRTALVWGMFMVSE